MYVECGAPTYIYCILYTLKQNFKYDIPIYNIIYDVSDSDQNATYPIHLSKVLEVQFFKNK